jgi:ribosome maturation factor RimP
MRVTNTGGVVTREISQFIEPILNEMDVELVDIEYLSGHGRWIVRIYVDKEGGITLDDCARVSREIGELIDVKDIIHHAYVLEVSSPGLNRPLKREKDFQRAIGKKVKAKMLVPLKGRKHFTGYLKSFRNGTLYLEVENNLVSLSWRDVEKANLVMSSKIKKS